MRGIGKKAVTAIISLIQLGKRDVEGIYQGNDFAGHLGTIDTGRPVLEIDGLRLADRFHQAAK
ncbi:hypothetical protein D3C86_2222220 [compost metagenome]